jgi:hypothetical protein
MANKYLDLSGLTSFLDKLKMHFNKRYCEGFKKIPTIERNFTRANWDLYGTIGRVEPWGNVTTGHGFEVGEYGVITGKVSDENDIYGNPKRAAIYGLVTGVTSNYVTMKTLYLEIEDTYYPGYKGNARVFYGVCSTAAGTTAKVVTCPDFTSSDLVEGAIIFVNFDNTNSGAVASLTLNVNSTGAKSIKQILNTSVSTLTSAGQIIANQTYMFVYDGTNWVTKLNYNSTYSSKTAAAGGTAVSLVTTGEKYTWNNKGNGTITGITMNGSSKGTSGVVDLGTVITAHQDISGKADKSATVSTVTWDSTNQKLTKTINGTASDVVTSDTLRTVVNDFYQASPSASTSCSAGTLTQVKLVSASTVTNGSGFSISSNGIKITTAGKYRISAGYSVSGMAAGISKVSFTIRKGSAFSGSSIVHQLTITTPGNSASWTSVFSVSSKIVELAANDILFLGANFTGGAGTVAGSTDTYLLVERVA